MKRYALPMLAAATATALAATPSAAAEVQLQATGPVVELSVTEQVQAEPDLVTIGAGVTTQAPTAVEAMRQNSVQMRQVIDRLKSLGVPERDIQTAGISLNAQYDYDDRTRQQVFRGYQAANRVSVELNDVASTGRVLDALVEAGANDLSGPQFSIADDASAKAQARRAAIQTAQAQANEYARLAGFSGVRLLQISETMDMGRPMPMARNAASMDIQESVPVQPGLVGTGVTVNVTYEMTR